MDNIMLFISKYGILATCLIILIEYACFPVSSEIVLPFSGAIAKINQFNLPFLIFLSVICGLLGSLICYYIGKHFGNKCITFIIKIFPKSKTAFDTSFNFFNKYNSKAVFFARLIPLCRTYISFVSGILEQSIPSFLLFSCLGIALWNTVLISLGYFLGSNWTYVIELYNNYKFLILFLLAILLLIYTSHKIRKK